MLAIKTNQAYSATALAKSSAGFSIPCTERKGAHSKRFFIAQSLWWAVRGLFRAPILSTGNANSVQPATHLISINGGSFQKHTEDAIMDDDARNKAVRLFAQLPYRKQYICLTIVKNPKLLEILANLPGDHAAVICEHMKALLFREANHV